LEEPEPVQDEAPVENEAEWTRSGSVLVVDDEEPIRRLAGTILESAGLTVFTAADGNEAIEVFRRHSEQIHAVLLDLTMPGMDGAEVFQHIHQLRPEVRVMLCSGYDENEVGSRLGGKRPAGFLRKPYHPRELLNLLETCW
jgi:CheY-like chemotaxis protein